MSRVVVLAAVRDDGGKVEVAGSACAGACGVSLIRGRGPGTGPDRDRSCRATDAGLLCIVPTNLGAAKWESNTRKGSVSTTSGGGDFIRDTLGEGAGDGDFTVTGSSDCGNEGNVDGGCSGDAIEDCGMSGAPGTASTSSTAALKGGISFVFASASLHPFPSRVSSFVDPLCDHEPPVFTQRSLPPEVASFMSPAPARSHLERTDSQAA